ncbi:MAG: alcohol dehydrogenase-like regulatory protein ErcA [Desulfobacterales bacterium]
MNQVNVDRLRKFVAPEFVFGAGARFLLENYLNVYEIRRPMLVTDSGVAEAGWAGEIIRILDQAGMKYTVFSQVTPNPKDSEVMTGAEIYREQGCDAIVALGGGSPMDCAKGIGIVCANRGHISDYEGVDRIPVPCPPLLCIPTTAGSAADVSQFAIVTDTLRRVKMAIVSKVLVPDVSLIDPETTVTMDHDLTAATGMDVFVHAAEALVSNANSAITDLHALEAVRLVCTHLKEACEHPRSGEFRKGMMQASLFAGLAFSNASLGAVHALAHSLGGYRDIPHGKCNAILLPHVVEYNFRAAQEAYIRMGRAMNLNLNEKSPDSCRFEILSGIRGLLKSLGIDQTLGQLGVLPEDIPRLAVNAMQDPCILTNPRDPDILDMEKLYAKAL